MGVYGTAIRDKKVVSVFVPRFQCAVSTLLEIQVELTTKLTSIDITGIRI
jgi:hypothetical protein